MKKNILTTFLIIIMLAINITNVYGVDISPIIDNADGTTGVDEVDDSLQTIVNNALGVISVFGVAIAFGMLIFVGVKLMSAAPSERAEVKKHIVPFVIGAVCILGATFIMNVLGILAEELLSEIVM